MGIVEVFLIGVGLSMDAFAVAVCKGLNMKKLNYRQGITIALFFGGFQAVMPLLGWTLGKQFEQYITKIDHFIAFGLLVLIGGNMIREAIKDDDNGNDEKESVGLNYKELFLMSIATSIDALAVGVMFAFVRVSIVPAISLIGVTTFILSFCGVVVGNFFGSKLKNKAEILGGVVLILMGCKILLEHLGILMI